MSPSKWVGVSGPVSKEKKGLRKHQKPSSPRASFLGYIRPLRHHCLQSKGEPMRAGKMNRISTRKDGGGQWGGFLEKRTAQPPLKARCCLWLDWPWVINKETELGNQLRIHWAWCPSFPQPSPGRNWPGKWGSVERIEFAEHASVSLMF